ncbi:hypothetical protein V6N13_042146 [Hibiscus sabdariffa]|uniref:Uncharacterized protein n=1 Tax=Hibiscus sabdariffa TaxID=183260 RepID=A0ABR2DE39_9ROSI
MGILQYPGLVNGESGDASAVKVSWANLESAPVNQSLESDRGKENRSPTCPKSSVYFKRKAEGKRDEKRIDLEIEATEKEITRLSLKLESLRQERAEFKARRVSMRGRTVASKFMVQKQSNKNFEMGKKIGDPLFSSAKTKLNRADVATLVVSMQSRRKSCFYKLRDTDEEKGKSRRGKSLSLCLSPKSRRRISTVGSKRAVRREDGVVATIQPKNLFQDGEKSETAKKLSKPGRVVASRTNQVANQSNGNSTRNNARKRSLIEIDESNRHGKRRASGVQVMDSCKNQKSKSRVKWETPVSVMVFNGEMEEAMPVYRVN